MIPSRVRDDRQRRGQRADIQLSKGLAVGSSGDVTLATSETTKSGGSVPTVSSRRMQAPAPRGRLTGPDRSVIQRGDGVAIDAAGNLYVNDEGNSKVRKIALALSSPRSPDRACRRNDGIGTVAEFNSAARHRCRFCRKRVRRRPRQPQDPKDYTGRSRSTFAGSGAIGSKMVRQCRLVQYSGGITLDSDGNLYVADLGDHRIRRSRRTPSSRLWPVRVPGSADGTGTAASFFVPTGIAIDDAGNLYVGDQGDNEIRS